MEREKEKKALTVDLAHSLELWHLANGVVDEKFRNLDLGKKPILMDFSDLLELSSNRLHMRSYRLYIFVPKRPLGLWAFA